LWLAEVVVELHTVAEVDRVTGIILLENLADQEL
jgi:hypothetical protein